MTDVPGNNPDQRVLVLAPTGKDATLTTAILERAGIASCICPNLDAVCVELDTGAGAVLVTEEMVTSSRNDCLKKWLTRQPTWSDLPILVLSTNGADSVVVAQSIDRLGNVIVLERPIRVATLVSAVQTALRGRCRQYETREHLAKIESKEKELSDFFDSASVGMHWVGADGTILRVNQTELDMLGYQRTEYVGKPLADFHVDSDVIEDILARLSRGETLQEYPARLRHKDGSIRHVAIHSNVLWENGRFVHSRCFTRDVSEKKRAEELRTRLDAVLATISEQFVVLDKEWKFVYVNEQAELTTGKRREELIGQSIWQLFPLLVGADFEREARLAMEERKPRRFELTDPTWNRWFEIRFYPSADSLTLLTTETTERRLAERELDLAAERTRQALTELQITYDQSPVGMLQLDTDLRYVRINEVMASMNGIPAADHIGKSIHEMVPELAPKLEPVFRKVMETGETLANIELVGKTADPNSEHIWLESWYPLRDGSGKVSGLNVVAQDITTQKRSAERIRRSEELLRFLIDRSPSGFYIVDADFRISYMNAESQARAFQNIRPAIGRGLDEAMRILWPEPLATELISIFRHTLDTGEPYKSPGLISPRNDLPITETYEWQLERITMPDGRYAVVCYYYDTTQLREIEQQLRDADQRKDEFLATLAHELRNPLAPIRNSLHILKLSASTNPAISQLSGMLERQVNHMVRLVDDLMEVSRITRGKIDLRMEPVTIAAVVRAAVETSQPMIDADRHQLALSVPAEAIMVQGDAVRLAQIVSNLLNNAAKYTEPGGQIWLSVRAQEKRVSISVRDTGLGISAEMLPRVFELFTQVDRTVARSQGGLGIGLTLVKALTEMHGGGVEARSEGLGKGSEFVIYLPILSQASTPVYEQSVSGPNAALGHRRILIVDDNQDAATSLGMLFEILGAEVRVAFDGPSALLAVKEFLPSVVLLDIGMPGMNGYEVAKQVRLRPEFRDIALVALTGWGQEEDRMKSNAAGIDHHLTKPADLGALQLLILSLDKGAGSRI